MMSMDSADPEMSKSFLDRQIEKLNRYFDYPPTIEKDIDFDRHA